MLRLIDHSNLIQPRCHQPVNHTYMLLYNTSYYLSYAQIYSSSTVEQSSPARKPTSVLQFSFINLHCTPLTYLKLRYEGQVRLSSGTNNQQIHPESSRVSSFERDLARRTAIDCNSIEISTKVFSRESAAAAVTSIFNPITAYLKVVQVGRKTPSQTRI